MEPIQMNFLAGLAIFLFLSLVALEIAGRLAGLHKPLLYLRTDYGYRVEPSQDLRILGKSVYYNQQGLRAPEINLVATGGTVRILCVGDSITNGGTVTDQAFTYPYVLGELLKETGIEAETLNGSANGWALENEAGWLKAHGIFNSNFVVLQVATHDLFQRQAKSELVDLNPSFPSRAPRLAIETLVRKIVLPRLGIGPDTRDPGYAPGVYTELDVERSLRALDQIRKLVGDAGGTLLVIPIEQPRRFEPVDELTLEAKARLRMWAAQSNVPVIETARAMEEDGGERLFRDPMHPNEKGNRTIARLVALEIARSRTPQM